MSTVLCVGGKRERKREREREKERKEERKKLAGAV